MVAGNIPGVTQTASIAIYDSVQAFRLPQAHLLALALSGVTAAVLLRIKHRIGSFQLDANFGALGGITGLFGPSGAGKTLTLRCIAGLTRPDEGRIALSNRVLLDTDAGVDLPPRERRIGYVFQQYALFPHLTVARNISFGIKHLSRAERDARVAQLLSLVGLPDLEGRMPSQLSGGQQQRVALARALATEPELLLLDEPFAAVDLRLRRRLRDELRRIQEASGTPMLLVTHDLHEVRQLCEWLVLIDSGRILRAEPTAKLLAEATDPDLAELLDQASNLR
jgi:molybdenum ABC transporter ATP-binding protein